MISVRTEALEAIKLVLQSHPSALIPPPPQLLPSMLEMVGDGMSAAASRGVRSPAGRSPGRQPLSALDRRVAVLDAMNALLCCQPVAAAAAALRDAAESSPSNADALTTRADGVTGASACGVDDFAFGQWRSQRPTAHASADADAQLDPIVLAEWPAVTAQCWVEVGVWLPNHAAGAVGEEAVLCSLSLVSLWRSLLALPAAQHGALHGSLRQTLLRHVAPHAPLPPLLAKVSADAAAKRRRLDVSLAELLAELLALSPSISQTPSRSPSAATSKLAVEETHLASRLCAFACDELGGRTDERRRDAGARAHLRLVIRLARALLVCTQADAEMQGKLLSSLLELWEKSSPAAACRFPLLRLFSSFVLPPSLCLGASAADAGMDLHERRAVFPPLLAMRWLRSLPKLLWQLQASQPALSAAMLRVLLACGRCALTLQPDGADAQVQVLQVLRPSLEPFFCARPKEGRPLVFGPYIALPEPVAALSLHVVGHMDELSETMLLALARCARERPDRGGQLLQAIQAAAARGALSTQEELSFYLTLVLDVASQASVDSEAAACSSAGEAERSVGVGTELPAHALHALGSAAVRSAAAGEAVRAFCARMLADEQAAAHLRARAKRLMARMDELLDGAVGA